MDAYITLTKIILNDMIKLLILILIFLTMTSGVVFVSDKPGEDGCAGLIFFGLAAITILFLIFGNY